MALNDSSNIVIDSFDDAQWHSIEAILISAALERETI
jgi:hypothetical protein